MLTAPDLLGRTAAVYLRKSRMEEGMDTDEVLRRHRQGLTECAQRHGLDIVEYYMEVVSGESLYARPQMLRLLEAVEAVRYDVVLCMDLDRLSRGRMKDQGIILDAFKDSGTLIVTPEKVYDLSDEIDDELAEFKTFMSRREYKIINKRLRRGLQRSIQDGCYVANAPYGYRKVTVDRRPTLEIYEPEAKFVRTQERCLFPQQRGANSSQPYLHWKDCLGPEKTYQKEQQGQSQAYHDLQSAGKVDDHRRAPSAHHRERGVQQGAGNHGGPLPSGL